MQINNTVVQALIQLRGLDLGTLAHMAHVTRESMTRWVSRGEEDAMDFEQQLEVLSYLGIRGETPRADVVHFWHIHEPMFSRPGQTYEALRIVLEAFGEAKVAHLSREAEPAFSWTAQVYFGLQFENFMAILKVTANPLRTISFDPARFEGLEWAPGALDVVLPRAEFDRLEPGSLQVRGLGNHLALAGEAAAWEQLRISAQNKGLRAEQVAHILSDGAAPAGVRLSMTPPPEPGHQSMPAHDQESAATPANEVPQETPVSSSTSAAGQPSPVASLTHARAARRPAFANVPRSARRGVR